MSFFIKEMSLVNIKSNSNSITWAVEVTGVDIGNVLFIISFQIQLLSCT